MTIALTTSAAAPRSETHHYFGKVAIAFCARFVEVSRQRDEQRRMLLAVLDLGHPGVLADMQTACGSERALNAQAPNG
jgi:hypothetical protein